MTRNQEAIAIIALASAEQVGELLAAAIDRAVELGRDAWLATSAAFDGEHESLMEALDWLSPIANGEEI